MLKWLSIIACLLLLQLNSLSQTPTLRTAIDKKEILIGQQFSLHISAVYNSSLAKITWFSLPDSIPHFDVIDRGRVDTIPAGDATTLQQTIVLTSFDSGQWRLPALLINFDPLKDDTTLKYFTDSLPVKVSYVLDTTQNLKDIKPIWDVKTFDPIWYYIIGGILLLLLIIAAVIVYRRRRKKKPAAIFSSNLTAYEEAKQELEKLKLYHLNLPGETKLYHTRLSEIFRRYASRKLSMNLMTKTTSDILLELKDKNFDPAQVTKVAAALRCGDAVKFAKYLPPLYESENAFVGVKEMIEVMERAGAQSNRSE